MNVIYAIAVGMLFAIGTYQLLSRDVLRITFGLYVMFNGANLLLMAVGTMRGLAAPFAQLPGPYVDPLVQAMVLTAIVIGFGLATLLMLLAARLAREEGSLDAEAMCRWRR